MEKKKPYSSKRWTEIPRFEVIGHEEVSEERQREGRKFLEEMMRQQGFLGPDEHLTEENDID